MSENKWEPIIRLPEPEWACHSTPGERPCPKCAEENRETKRMFVAVFVLSVSLTILLTTILVVTGKM